MHLVSYIRTVLYLLWCIMKGSWCRQLAVQGWFCALQPSVDVHGEGMPLRDLDWTCVRVPYPQGLLSPSARKAIQHRRVRPTMLPLIVTSLELGPYHYTRYHTTMPPTHKPITVSIIGILLSTGINFLIPRFHGIQYQAHKMYQHLLLLAWNLKKNSLVCKPCFRLHGTFPPGLHPWILDTNISIHAIIFGLKLLSWRYMPAIWKGALYSPDCWNGRQVV